MVFDTTPTSPTQKAAAPPSPTQAAAPPSPKGSAPIKSRPSFLNNDGIDEMQPTRRKRVSSISLSDQWAGGLSMTPSSANLKHSGSRKSVSGSRRGSQMIRYKKSVIDHARVASYAFAFDIDGVILRGPNIIPQAKEAIRMLNGHNKYNITVPYIFVTNGGGRDESARAAELSTKLDAEVTKEQVIQGHTPMRDLVDIYNNVLVVGGVGDKCRKVAESYGFKNVFIPLDVMKWDPSVSPYHTLTPEEEAVTKDVDFSKTKIDGILVFADSRDWAADQQIILELLMSKGGYMGTRSETFDEGPGIYFAHSDFIWATNYKLSRYGMGALQVSIAALFQESTGKELKVTRFGKPQRGTFQFATKVLSSWRKDVLDEHVSQFDATIAEDDEEVEDKPDLSQKPSAAAAAAPGGFGSDSESEEESDDEGLTVQKLSQLTLDLPPASTVYFIGDTPESDIRFANSHDDSWYSILVKTGVYQGGSIPKYTPKHTCEDVLEAVKFGIEREQQMELAEWNASAVDAPSQHGEVSVPVTLEEKVEIQHPPTDEKPSFSL